MPDIVISEFMDEAAVADLASRHDTLYDERLVDRPAELADAVAGCRALIVRNRTQVRGALLAAAGRLEVVGRLGVGLDNIDLDACRERRIAVHPATGANDLSVAEYVITTVMLLLRGAYARSAEVAAGKWPRNALIGGETSGRCLGLVGFGSIARETAHRARALGMTCVAFDPYLPAGDAAWQGTGRLGLDELLATADVVSLHVPLTPETKRLIDGAALEKMKQGSILINAARGGVVDEAALAASLRAGHLKGAALDVFEQEPLGADAGAVFAGLDNLILTPHIAGVTTESNVRVSQLIADTILRSLEGGR